MSYDIYAKHKNGEDLVLPKKHNIKGGTYVYSGTDEAHLNITYNYSPFFYKHLHHDQGLRYIYGKSVRETLGLLRSVILTLDDDVTEDYWEATEGNAKCALLGLYTIGELALDVDPDAVWDGD